MRIQSVHIENFGKLHDLDMELKEGLNVICASNGWGKTTLAAFLKAMFYGLDYTTKRSLKENERKKYTPWQGGPFGGSMEFTVGDRSYRVERFFGAKDKEDTFRLCDLSTGLESTDYSERLGEELFHLDRAAFERSSFFAQQDFGTSLNDSLNARLTRVEEDAGDMQNYEKAMASLEERMKYFQKTGNRGQLAQLERQRHQVLDDLAQCRNKENAISEWKEKRNQKEQQAEELRLLTHEAEEQLRKIQEYEARAERRDRYEFLRQQVGVKEEQLRRTGEELARFTEAPLKEQELDRCHEGIYRIHTLLMQEKDAEEKVRQAETVLEQTRQEGNELPRKQDTTWVGILLGVFAVAFLALILLGLYQPGIACLAGAFLCGCLYVHWIQQNKRIKEQADRWEAEFSEREKEWKDARQEYETFRENRDRLEDQIRRILHIPEGTAAEEMEYYWKLERQNSQNYAILKQNYEAQNKEYRKAREAFLEYAGRFSEAELAEFCNLQEPEQDVEELKKLLDAYGTRRESLIQEQTSIQNQVRVLSETAERIPELEEESDRLAREIEEGTREHALLEKTMKYLKTAREQFSTRYLKELQQGLENYLALLEPEQAGVPSLDVKLKVKLREAGAARELDYFSAGWQDMIQIAERFSIVDALYEEEQPILILDDPFVNLDTEKQERAMELLNELSKKWQMIYFTCHREKNAVVTISNP